MVIHALSLTVLTLKLSKSFLATDLRHRRNHRIYKKTATVDHDATPCPMIPTSFKALSHTLTR